MDVWICVREVGQIGEEAFEGRDVCLLEGFAISVNIIQFRTPSLIEAEIGIGPDTGPVHHSDALLDWFEINEGLKISETLFLWPKIVGVDNESQLYCIYLSAKR